MTKPLPRVKNSADGGWLAKVSFHLVFGEPFGKPQIWHCTNKNLK
jgi:hypothetical protein